MHEANASLVEVIVKWKGGRSERKFEIEGGCLDALIDFLKWAEKQREAGEKHDKRKR